MKVSIKYDHNRYHMCEWKTRLSNVSSLCNYNVQRWVSVYPADIQNVVMGHIISITGPIYCAQTGLWTYVYFYDVNVAYRRSSAHLETLSPVHLRPLQAAVTMRPIADIMLQQLSARYFPNNHKKTTYVCV
jgi:hypothetical protein